MHSLIASLLLLAHPGAPIDGKTCYGSLQIGDLLGSKPWTVHDINMLKRGSSVVAWIYKDQNGKFWVEKNARAQFPRFVGNAPPQVPPGTTFAKCWAQGSQF